MTRLTRVAGCAARGGPKRLTERNPGLLRALDEEGTASALWARMCTRQNT
jgi:hypothetical protein